MKLCVDCGETRRRRFYKSVNNRCRVHFRLYVKQCRANSRDYYLEFDRQRNKDKKRVAMRERYAQTPAGRRAGQRAKTAWRERNPEKYKAHTIVGNAIRDGRLVRGACEVCGTKRVHAHHNDYSKPLVVRWLCSAHHRIAHVS